MLLAPVACFSPGMARFGASAGASAAGGLAPTLGATAGTALAATIGVAVTSESTSDMMTSQIASAADEIGVVIFSVAVVAAYLRYSGESRAEEKEDWACLVPEVQIEDEPVCGAVSFDSSDEMTCVETFDAAGQLRWRCA